MPVTATSAQETFIGAGDVYVDGVAVGATQDSNVFRVVREYFAPTFNGAPGPLKGTDYITSETAELEVTIPELDTTKLPYMVPGAVSVAGDAQGVALGGGGSGTLAADSVIGATNIKVSSVTNISQNDVIQVGAAGSREFRKVITVGTTGAGGTGLDLDAPLTKAHTTGDAFTELQVNLLAADSAVGATNLKVASVTGLVVGDWVRIGWAVDAEVRRLTFVGTTGSGGTGISFNEPLVQPHRTGDYTIEQTTSGSSTISSDTGNTRRIPSSAYHTWQLRIPGLDGRAVWLTVYNAIMTENMELEATDDGNLAPRLVLQARWDPAAITTSPWLMEKIGATA